MKNIIILLFALLPFISSAQMSYKTGSGQLDASLNRIDARASIDFGAFKAEMSVAYDVSEKKIEYMHGSLEMTAGEIYIALEISKLSKTHIDDVLHIYSNNKGKGWGYIAKEAGIKPGSPEFHQLKSNAKYKGQKGKGKQKSKEKNKGKKQ
ncbi:hypothetical protein KEM09_18740 [Carboxylicivirga mesophila]|uniref:Uncharacterized protein n=1 Tax=Carboxylicivirga mesophila TaxID=1166478 RepID=A0ABS5KEW9_9BACT|nr:hypothetical protein [Carboxylicivirga mesophila]MBS2213454.1 hypothetical protein [Carboxylicivirga mesophila]